MDLPNPSPPESPVIVLLAGEPSGDFLGAQLMKALKALSPLPLVFEGTGGPLMRAEGQQTYVDVSSLSVMGFLVGLGTLRQLKNALDTVLTRIKKQKPQAVITIDFPGFNFKIAKHLQGHGIPLFHYVAPTVWAWRPKRAKKVATLYDHLFCLFDFEPPYFEAYHLQTTFVGHPLEELPWDQIASSTLRKDYAINSQQKIIVMLPGSRLSEINRHLPLFKATYEQLRFTWPNLVLFIPTVPAFEESVKVSTASWGHPVHVTTDSFERLKIFKGADVALAASGTVTLELAKAGLPMVVAYKTSFINGWIAKQLLKVPYVSLVNILANQEIVPEYLQKNCTPERLYEALSTLLSCKKNQDTQRKAFKSILPHIKSKEGLPSTLAAKKILEYINKT